MIEMNEVAVQQPNLIGMDDNDATIANVFCFGAFVEKTIGIVCNQIIPVCVAGQERVFLCPIPLQIKLHPCYPNKRNG